MHTRAMGFVQCVFREQPCVGIKKSQHFGEIYSGLPWFIPHLSLPHQPAVTLPSYHTSAVLSIPLLPAFTLTHRTAPGWPPDPQQSRAGPRLLLAGAVRPWHNHSVPLGKPVPAGASAAGGARGADTVRGQWLSSLPCRSPEAGRAHVHSILACYPGSEAGRDSWVTLSTEHFPQSTLLQVSRALASHCWQRNWQPLPSHLCSPWAEEQGLERFPKCFQLSPRHCETEIQIHVSCNLNLGKCPAIRSVRRKGKAP